LFAVLEPGRKLEFPARIKFAHRTLGSPADEIDLAQERSILAEHLAAAFGVILLEGRGDAPVVAVVIEGRTFALTRLPIDFRQHARAAALHTSFQARLGRRL
jgi:hypothetical protein